VGISQRLSQAARKTIINNAESKSAIQAIQEADSRGLSCDGGLEMASGFRRGRSVSGRPAGRKPSSLGSAEDTARHILRMAVALFNERGYEAVTVDQIASLAGVNRATIYYHFEGKEALFLAAFERIMNFAGDQTAQICAREDLSVKEKVIEIVRTRRSLMGVDHGERLDEMDHGMVRAALSSISPAGHGRIGQLFGRLHALTTQLIREGVERGELPQLSIEVLNFAFWALFPADGYPPYVQQDRATVEEELLRLFLGLP
jgi:AcrR family transcriptional regulator